MNAVTFSGIHYSDEYLKPHTVRAAVLIAGRIDELCRGCACRDGHGHTGIERGLRARGPRSAVGPCPSRLATCPPVPRLL